MQLNIRVLFWIPAKKLAGMTYFTSSLSMQDFPEYPFVFARDPFLDLSLPGRFQDPSCYLQALVSDRAALAHLVSYLHFPHWQFGPQVPQHPSLRQQQTTPTCPPQVAAKAPKKNIINNT